MYGWLKRTQHNPDCYPGHDKTVNEVGKQDEMPWSNKESQSEGEFWQNQQTDES